jgi:drug/metabolite transporter (DMT)-like permease
LKNVYNIHERYLTVLKNISIYKNKKFVATVAAFCCLLWGSAFPAVKIGYAQFQIAANDVPSKLVFAGYRFLLAGIIVLLIAYASGKKISGLSKRSLFEIFTLGLIQTTVQYIFFYVGLSNTTGVKGSIMNSTGAFFGVIIAHFLYKNDKMSRQKIIGCIIGFCGVMAVNLSPDLLDFSFSFTGDGFVIVAALVFSIAGIYGKHLCQKSDVMLVTGISLFTGSIILIILGMLFGGRVYHFTINSSLLLLYMCALSAIAFSLWALLLKYNKVGQVSVFNFLIPVFGALLSSVFLGESILEVKNLVAFAAVCLGIWLVNREKDMPIHSLGLSQKS